MTEKIVKRKGSAEGATNNEKSKPNDVSEPQATTQPMTEPGVAASAGLAQEAKNKETATETGMADLRAYAPAMALEPIEAQTAVEAGEDMREIMEANLEADMQPEAEIGDDEEDDEDAAASVSEEPTGESSESAAESDPEIEISDAEAKEIASECRGKAINADREQEDIGKIIFHKGFKGRMDLVSSKDPLKSASFAKIHKLLDDIFTAKTLSTLTRAAAFREKLMSLGKESQKLSFGHLRELVSVQDENGRMELAEEVYRKSLSVQKTRKRVTEVNAEQAPEKSLKRIVRKMQDPLSLPGGKEFETIISDPDRLQKDLSKSERMSLRSGIAKKTEHIDKCLSCLKELDEFLAMIDS